jgi:hypothetical protein
MHNRNSTGDPQNGSEPVFQETSDRDNLKVLVRWGLMLWLFQTLLTVDLLMP